MYRGVRDFHGSLQFLGAVQDFGFKLKNPLLFGGLVSFAVISVSSFHPEVEICLDVSANGF